MPNPHLDQVRKAHGDKLYGMTGERGEHPSERAMRIAELEEKPGKSAQGSAAQPPEEVFTKAPARQISNYGNVRK